MKPEFKDVEECMAWHVKQAVNWCLMRESVRLKKEAGEPKPWTQDEFLQNYRFCNVNRQHDKETVLLNEHFFNPHADSKDVWFNAAVARWINWSKSVLAVGWTDLTNGYDPDDMYRRMTAVELGPNEKFFTGAYMVRGCTSAKEVDGDVEFYEKCKDKKYFLAHAVFKGIAEIGPPMPGEKLEEYHARLTTAKSNGAFMAGQQIADIKYYTMKDASDWNTWAPIGPGPVRFLNRMFNRPLEKQIPKAQHYEELGVFFKMFFEELERVDSCCDAGTALVIDLVRHHCQDAHNLGSNVLCETDKYIRLQDGGRVRSLYPGKASSTQSLLDL